MLEVQKRPSEEKFLAKSSQMITSLIVETNKKINSL